MEAISLYNHVSGEENILDGMVPSISRSSPSRPPEEATRLAESIFEQVQATDYPVAEVLAADAGTHEIVGPDRYPAQQRPDEPLRQGP